MLDRRSTPKESTHSIMSVLLPLVPPRLPETARMATPEVLVGLFRVLSPVANVV